MMPQRIPRDRRRTITVERLECRYAMTGDASFCFPYVASAASTVDPGVRWEPSEVAGATAVTANPVVPVGLSVSARGDAEGESRLAQGRSPFDSNGDGLVTPLDALNILAHLANVQRGTAVNDPAAIRRFDTSGDGDVTPLDALRVLSELARHNRDHGGALNVPLASWVEAPQMVGGTLATENLALRLTLATGVRVAYGQLASGGGTPVNLSSMIAGDQIHLSHAQIVSLFSPEPNRSLAFSFWTDLPQQAVKTTIDVTWSQATGADVLWIEDAENGYQFIQDRSHASSPLIQSSVVVQGTHAFHLTHPTAASSWFSLTPSLAIGTDTKLYFHSRLNWATPTQVAKVQLSTDGGTTWPTTIFSQSGDANAPAGDGGFRFHQVDLSAFAGRNVHLRFLYDYTGGSWFPQVTTNVGWVIDDIRIGSTYETRAYEIGQPTELEQWLLEFANRARADGIAEANRLARDPSLANVFSQYRINPDHIVSQYTASIANGYLDRHAQPLAFNASLLEAARLHSQDMLTNAFQGHSSSSNPPAPFQRGFSPSQRAAALGYSGGVAENVYAFSTSVPFGHAGFVVDWGAESPGAPGYNPAFAGQGMQNPAGHRRNIHNDDYNEVGFAVVVGNHGNVGPQVVTQKFGSVGAPMITGVVYTDLDQNQFYTPGEGIGGIRVEVQGAAFHAITAASGGYAVPVSGAGTYLVTFSGPTVQTRSFEVVVGDRSNVKLDYVLIA